MTSESNAPGGSGFRSDLYRGTARGWVSAA
jgi:hypothetical protein